MRLLWHIILKDARRVRWPLALWAAVMAGRYLLGAALLRASHLDAAGWQQLAAYDDWLWAVQIILAYLLAGWIVQEDLLVDTRAFWLTRPISRLRMLGAKLLGVGLLVGVLPAIVALPWWLACGYGVREVAAAAAETVFWFACLSAVAMALASLTDDLARFVLYSFILLLVASTYGVTLEAVKMKWNESLQQGLESGMVQTRVWVTAVWVLVIGGTATAHQYLTRRTHSSWAVLVVGLLAIIGPVQFWPWDLSEWAIAKQKELPLVQGIAVDYVEARIWPAQIGPGDAGRVRLEPLLRLTGIPEQDAVFGLHLECTLSWPDGVQYSAPESEGWEKNQTPSVYGPLNSKAWVALGLTEEHLWNHASTQAFRQWFQTRPRIGFRGQEGKRFPPGSWSFSIHAPTSLGAKMLRQPPQWNARIDGELLQPRVAAMMPLRAGAHGGHGGEGMTVVGLQRTNGPRAVLTLTQSWSTAGTVKIFDASMVSYREANEWGYLIFSGDKTRVADPWGSGFLAHRIGSVAVVRRQLTINAPTGWNGRTEGPVRWEVDPAWPGWLDQATLVRVVPERVGRFEQALHVDRFEVEPTTPAPVASR